MRFFQRLILKESLKNLRRKLREQGILDQFVEVNGKKIMKSKNGEKGFKESVSVPSLAYSSEQESEEENEEESSKEEEKDLKE